MKSLQDLQDQWNFVIQQGFNEDRMLGIFNIDNSFYELIILPSFSSLCLRRTVDYPTVTNKNKIIKIKDILFLKEKISIEEENVALQNNYFINPKYENLFNNYFIKNKDLFIYKPITKETLKIIDNGIVEILKYSLLEEFFTDSKLIISKKDFLKQLTNAEIKAYYSIVNEIGAEGNITISKLVEKNTISRPVYNNLIVKIKENNIASVINMGMKGTYIKILEPELRAEAINYK